MVFQFYIVEVHRNAAGEYEHVVHWTWDADYDKALVKGESKYYEVLSRAAVSEYVLRSAIVAMQAAQAEMQTLIANAYNAINEAAGDLRSQIPTKVSQLTNDSDYINTTDAHNAIDTAAANVRAQIPTKVSELTNDKCFIESVIDE